MIKTIHGSVPMDADVLMLGVASEHFDDFQRGIKGGFQSRHMGWSYVANLSPSFEHAASNYIPKRPTLDVIYIDNDGHLSKQVLLLGAQMLMQAMRRMEYDIKPYIALTASTEFLAPFFDGAGFVAEHNSIENLAGDRHTEKRRIADSQAA